jgi:hypothetical protein
MRRITFLIFASSLGIRLAVSTFQITHGINEISWLPTLTMWSDFYGYYVHQLAYIRSGLIPYRDFGYSYTPLFLYILYPFYAVGGSYFASFPIVIADSATGPLLYLILRRSVPEKIAILGGLSYGLSLFAIVYEGYLWLSSQPMTLFILIGVYFASQNKNTRSSLLLTLAAMTKQEAFFIFPVYLKRCLQRHRSESVRILGAIAGVISVVSLPFLILSGTTYLAAISYGATGILSGNPAGSTLASGNGLSGNNINCTSVTLTLLGTHSGCSYFFISYPHPLLTYVFDFLNFISQWTLVPLLAITAVVLYLSRDKQFISEIAGAFLIIVFLTLFAHFINPVHRYYLIPAYALLIASCRNMRSILTIYVTFTISLLTVAGAFQLFLVTLAVLAIIALQDVSS